MFAALPPIHSILRAEDLQARRVLHHGKGRGGGFSLTELLVVFGVLALLSGGIALALRGDSGKSLRVGRDLVASQLNAARTTAILNNSPAVLLIETAPEAASTKQRLAIAREVASANGTVALERVTPFVRLPQGIHVVLGGEVPFSTKDSRNIPPEIINYAGSDWAVYRFSSTGACEENTGARVILAGGVAGNGSWTRPNKSLVQGIFLTRLGETLLFEDPAHINESFGGQP
jgi:type II secretory pathway pseudopilin PulG